MSYQKPTCPITANSTRRGSLLRHPPHTARPSNYWGRKTFPSVRKFCSSRQRDPVFTFFVEICEDLRVPTPCVQGRPRRRHGNSQFVGVEHYDRQDRVSSQPGRQSVCALSRCILVHGCWHGRIDNGSCVGWPCDDCLYENGVLLAESARFRYESHWIKADIDLERLSQERMRQNSFGQSMECHAEELRGFRRVSVDIELPTSGRLLCARQIERFPYVPADPELREKSPVLRGL